jgi:uncharacterized protein (DUF1015 family)
MLEVKGFRGLRFDPAKVGSLDAVITPPYDVITPDQRRDLVARSPYSMVHLILPEARGGLNCYEAAARNFADWQSLGVLEQDDANSLYILEQIFSDADGATRRRRAFLATARIPEPGDATIMGHEQTFLRTFEDRLLLTQATRANLGPVFTLYADPNNALESFLRQSERRPPDLVADTIDGVTQKLWRVPRNAALPSFMLDKRLYIADGHHRYRTACAYRDLMRERSKNSRPTAGPLPHYEYVLLGFVSLSDPGLTICATHRLMSMPRDLDAERFLADLRRWFDVTPADDHVIESLNATPGCAFAAVIHGAGVYLLTLKDIDRVAFLGEDHGPAWRDLDVAVLHRGIIETILGLPAETKFVYEHDASTVLSAVRSGEYGMGFLLKATPPEQIQACAEAGESMPHKSTYFFPKLPSGAVIHRLE